MNVTNERKKRGERRGRGFLQSWLMGPEHDVKENFECGENVVLCVNATADPTSLLKQKKKTFPRQKELSNFGEQQTKGNTSYL